MRWLSSAAAFYPASTYPDRGIGPALLGHYLCADKQTARTHCFPTHPPSGAGTGKTHTLLNRGLFMLKEGVDPTSILFISFTNKAVEEIAEVS